jgi:hypothetical protein
MAMRLGTLAIVALLSGGLGLTGCAHPYSGKPEKLKKMKKKKKPEPEEGAEQNPEVVWDDDCRVNFLDDKRPKRRNERSAKSLTNVAAGMISEAEELEGERRIVKVIDALNKLKSALGKDQFNPEATYKMAVAYTLVRKKGCALQLLQRLQDLQRMPEVAREAELAAKRATRDPIFDPFRKDADAAVGL